LQMLVDVARALSDEIGNFLDGRALFD